MHNTIALCIPAYNAAWCLPRLLKSAQNQHILFDEILVYNDYSIDDTETIALKYGAKVINGINNRGCSFGKNMLAELAESEWLHFHDSDDLLLPNFTTLAHKWINQEDCPDVVLFSYEYRNYRTNALLGIRKFNNESLNSKPIKYSIEEQINPFCGLYRKSSFLNAGGYDCDSNILYNEDSDLHISLAVNGLKFASEEKISIINYYFPCSMSQSNLEQCAISRFYVLEKISKTLGVNYQNEIVAQMFACVNSLAVYENWLFVKKGLKLIKNLGQPNSVKAGKLFNVLWNIHPFFAVWLREKMIRLFKPKLRVNE